jgi:hypothetical protein
MNNQRNPFTQVFSFGTIAAKGNYFPLILVGMRKAAEYFYELPMKYCFPAPDIQVLACIFTNLLCDGSFFSYRLDD